MPGFAMPAGRLCALALAIGTVLLTPVAARADDAATVSERAAGAVLTRAPARLAVDTAAPVDPASSTLRLLDVAGDPVAIGAPAAVAGDPERLVATLPKLEPGLYTAVYDAGGAQGSFAFSADPSGVSPTLARSEAPPSRFKPATTIVPKWLAFSFIFVFVGALALRALVVAPLARGRGRRRGPGTLAETVDRRLLAIAAVAIALFVPSTLAQLVDEAADPDAGLGFWHSIRPGDIWSFLSGEPDGRLWLARLILTALAASVVIPTALAARTRGVPRRVDALALAGLALGGGELLARVLPTAAPDVRDAFTQLLDLLHMLGAAVWVGGLATLAALALSRLRVPAGESFWAPALRRFSVVATVCVGVMILTGLWTTWIHVGAPRLLFTTLYGETVLVKLILVLILVALGAVNQLWMLPRVNALRASGAASGSALAVALGHFRHVVVAEAVVGLAIVAVVPFLSGSARNQDFQRRQADLAQTRGAVTLAPSGNVAGPAQYDVVAPGARRVDVSFSSPALGVPATTVVADAVGDDRFRVSGGYATAAGDWRIAVDGGAGMPAVFTLPVLAAAAEPGKAPTPAVASSTWAWGIAELLIVLIALLGATRISARIAQRRVIGLDDARLSTDDLKIEHDRAQSDHVVEGTSSTSF